MKISERTVSAISQIITGDKAISPYRSGPKLVKFFNEFGTNAVYGRGFPPDGTLLKIASVNLTILRPLNR